MLSKEGTGGGKESSYDVEKQKNIKKRKLEDVSDTLTTEEANSEGSDRQHSAESQAIFTGRLKSAIDAEDMNIEDIEGLLRSETD